MVGNNALATQHQQELAAAQAQQGRRTEEHEYEGKASAQAGLNLNIFAAVSGIFSGKSKKTTDTNADGSSHSVEHSKGAGKMHGAGHGVLNAVGKTDTEVRERHRITEEAVSQNERRNIETVDHLGIEDTPRK